MGGWSKLLDTGSGGEYLLGYVLIEKKHSGTIFTPKNNFSCKNFKGTPYFGALWRTTLQFEFVISYIQV